MTWLDALILLPLLIGLVRGLMRGFIVELTAIVAIILGFLGSKLWGVSFAIWINKQVTWPETVCIVVAYALLFLGITLLLNILAKLLSKLFKKVHLGGVNRFLGAIFGVVKWASIILFIVLCLHRLDEQFHFLNNDLKQQSKIYTYITPISEKAWIKVKEQVATYSSQSSKKITEENQQKNEQE